MMLNKSLPRITMRSSQPMSTGPFCELTGDRRRFSVTVGYPVGQDIPDQHQQFPGDGDNGFVPADAGGQGVKLGFPVGMVADGSAGRLRPGSDYPVDRWRE
jgi:hypothetical protein